MDNQDRAEIFNQDYVREWLGTDEDIARMVTDPIVRADIRLAVNHSFPLREEDLLPMASLMSAASILLILTDPDRQNAE